MKNELQNINQPATNAEALIAQAIDKNVPVETMEKLLAMRRELKAERSRELYFISLAALQSELPVISKTKHVLNKNGTARYSYAPLESIVTQIKTHIKKHGFSYTIDTPAEQGWLTAVCKVVHEAGHEETSSFRVPIDAQAFMNVQQQYAAALTYAKRYAFCNAFGILTGDEDTDAATVGEETLTPKQMAEKIESGMVCETCGKPAEEKTGVSKTNKPWHGIFCSDNRAHVKWIHEKAHTAPETPPLVADADNVEEVPTTTAREVVEIHNKVVEKKEVPIVEAAKVPTITTDQNIKIRQLMMEKGLTLDDMDKPLKKLHVEKIGELSFNNADALIERMSKLPKKKENTEEIKEESEIAESFSKQERLLN